MLPPLIVVLFLSLRAFPPAGFRRAHASDSHQYRANKLNSVVHAREFSQGSQIVLLTQAFGDFMQLPFRLFSFQAALFQNGF